MKDECPKFTGVCMISPRIRDDLQIARNINLHMLIIHLDPENKLIAEVILFINPDLSFGVLISEDASEFYNLKEPLIEVVDIKINQN